MLKTVFGKTLYEKRWVILIWFVSLVFYVWLTMLFYPFLKTTFTQSLSSVPKSLQGLLGSAKDYQTVRGYVSQEIFSLRAPMITIIMTVSIFIGISAGDEERGSLENLLAQPVSRAKVFWQKLAAGAVINAIAIVGIWLGVVISFPEIHGTMPLWPLTLATFACWIITMVFGVITYGLGAILGRRGVVIGIVSAVAFLMYLLTSIAPAVSSLHQTQKLSIFYYYNTPPVTTNGINWTNMALQVAIIVVFAVVGWLIFQHRDLRKD